MMTSQEADEFIKNPGPPGFYRFTSTKPGKDRLRKWNGTQWHVGTDQLENEADWIRFAKSNPKLDMMGMLKKACMGGMTPYRFADIEGNKIGTPSNPEQLDLFDFN